MIQDKIIGAAGAIGNVGQALTMAAARQEFKAQEAERAEIKKQEEAKEEEFKNIQENLKGIRSGVLSDIEATTKDPTTGKWIYPGEMGKELSALGTANWTPTGKAETYKNQFADPARAAKALQRLTSYSKLLQEQRAMFRNDPQLLTQVQEKTLKNYRQAELESLIDRRGPNKKSKGGK